MIILVGLHLRGDFRHEQAEDFCGGEGGVFGFEDDKRGDAGGHSEGGVDVRAAKAAGGRWAGDDGGGDRRVYHAAEGVAPSGDGDVHFRARGGFVLVEQIQQAARGFVGRGDVEGTFDAECVEGGDDFGDVIFVGGGAEEEDGEGSHFFATNYTNFVLVRSILNKLAVIARVVAFCPKQSPSTGRGIASPKSGSQ